MIRLLIALAIIAFLVAVAILLRMDRSPGESLNVPASIEATGSKPHREVLIRQPSPDDLMRKKLESIILPEVAFEEITVPEAIDFIHSKTRELDTATVDPAQRGIRFSVRIPLREKDLMDLLNRNLVQPPGDPAIPAEDSSEPERPLVKDIYLRNVKTLDLLNEICAQTKMAWKIERGTVIVFPVAELPE
jgi:hypothetical protein